jgi:hypothetical protein
MTNNIIRTYAEEKKLEELIEKVKEIDILKDPNTNTFEKISRSITNKENILQFINIFNKVFNKEYENDIGANIVGDVKNVRTFLGIFMIIHCEEIIFAEIGEIEKQIIKLAKNLLENFQRMIEKYNDIEILKEFSENYTEYKNLFEAWKNQDKDKLLLALYTAYQDLIETQKKIREDKYENETDKETAVLWSKEIDNQKKLIETEVRKIGGDESIEKFISGELLINFLPQELKDNIVKNLQKAYWDKVKEELTKEDIPQMTIKTLNELKKKIKELVPSREDLHEKWEKEFKFEILSYKFNNLEDRNNFIMENVKTFINILLDLESKERNESFQEVMKKADDFNMEDRIVELLYQCYMHIDYIYLDIQNLKKRLEEYQKK